MEPTLTGIECVLFHARILLYGFLEGYLLLFDLVKVEWKIFSHTIPHQFC